MQIACSMDKALSLEKRDGILLETLATVPSFIPEAYSMGLKKRIAGGEK